MIGFFIELKLELSNHFMKESNRIKQFYDINIKIIVDFNKIK